jgi:hypothetical protein
MAGQKITIEIEIPEVPMRVVSKKKTIKKQLKNQKRS